MIHFKDWHSPLWGSFALALGIVCFVCYGPLLNFDPDRIAFVLGVAQALLGTGSVMIGIDHDRRHHTEYGEGAAVIQMMMGGFMCLLSPLVIVAGISGATQDFMPLYIVETGFIALALGTTLIGPSVSWRHRKTSRA